MAKQSEATLLLKIKETGSGLLSKTKNALSDIRTWAVAAFAALTSGAAVKAFKEQEEAVNALNQALINQGLYSDDLSRAYQKMASDLQRTTKFGDEAIVSAQAQLQSYLGQTKITKELIKATLDLATAKKIDLHSAAELVGKSIGTEMNAIRRAGIDVELTGTKQERMIQLTEALNGQFKNQAGVAAQGLGQIAVTKNMMGEVAELVGQKLSPLVILLNQNLIQLSDELLKNTGLARAFGAGISILTIIFITIKSVVLSVTEIITGTLGTIIVALMNMATGNFSGALKTITNGFSAMNTNIKHNTEEAAKDISQVLDNFTGEQVKKRDEEERMLRESELNKGHIIKTGAQDMNDFFKARNEEELFREMTHLRLRNNLYLQYLNSVIETEKGTAWAIESEQKKRKFLDEQYKKDEIEREGNVGKIKAVLYDERVDSFKKGSDKLSEMQNSKNKTLAGIGKAAALANIAIDTARGALGVYVALSPAWAGPAGVVAGIAGAAAITAYGAEKAANVAGINLAEGGLIKATPGGVRAIIGEGGRDEAVIPLDNAQTMGHQINIVIQGGLLGDATQAREFAIALDKELFRLRQSNQSIAFDEGII